MDEEFLEVLKALSDATRQEILEFLNDIEECNVNEICETFTNITQPTVSHHLQILKRCKLVGSHRRGKMVFYRIRRNNMHIYFKTFLERFEK